MSCMICGKEHETKDCTEYTPEEKELLLTGASLLSGYMASDYAYNCYEDFEREITGRYYGTDEEEDEEEE